MNRRAFLAAVPATAMAGCGGGGGDGGVPGAEATATPTATTTTTTQPAADDAAFDSADVGPYPEWMVQREGATLFLFTYYPQFAWLVEQVPEEDRNDIQLVLQSAGRGNPRPTSVLDPFSVEEFFYGFTDVDGLAYILARGSFDAAAAREALQSEKGYEPLDRSVGEFDLLGKGQRVVGVTDELLIDVEVGFADPVANFEVVHETVRGDAPSYTAENEAYALLVENLQEGHRIRSRPNAADALGVDAYGRQTVYGGEFSRIQEVLVGGEAATAERARAAVTANSSVFNTLSIEIASVEADGEVATVTYEPHTNAILWGGRY